MMKSKRARRLAGWAVVCGLAAGAGLYRQLNLPFSAFGEEVFVELPRGTGTVRIAEMLETSGVVRSRWLLLAARLLRPGSKLQAGEYRFHKRASALEVYDRIARGDVFYIPFTVPEGANMFEIGASLEAAGIMESEEFLRRARNPDPIRDLAPDAPSLEGYLFPSTYWISRSTTAAELCRRLTGEFRRVWQELNAQAPPHETVTLASMVEKETAVPAERELVASVFRNRLELGMKLDCDPTTIYAALLEGRYRGRIHVSDLQDKNPYNTYQHAGLPPGPIANPGLASLKAALTPADSNYLYFVARPGGSGEHSFSASLQQHQVAVTRYRGAGMNRNNGKEALQAKTTRGVPGGKKTSRH